MVKDTCVIFSSITPTTTQQHPCEARWGISKKKQKQWKRPSNEGEKKKIQNAKKIKLVVLLQNKQSIGVSIKLQKWWNNKQMIWFYFYGIVVDNSVKNKSKREESW